MKIVLLFAAIIGIQNVNALGGLTMGPLNINLVRSSACAGDQNYMVLDVVDVDGSKKGLTFELNLPFPMDDTISYESFVHQVQNGQLKKNVFKHGGPNACTDFEKFLGKVWKKLTEAAGMPPGCPKQPGKYRAEKFPFDDKDVDVRTFFYGRFILVIHVKKAGELLACREIEFTNSRPGDSVM